MYTKSLFEEAEEKLHNHGREEQQNDDEDSDTSSSSSEEEEFVAHSAQQLVQNIIDQLEQTQNFDAEPEFRQRRLDFFYRRLELLQRPLAPNDFDSQGDFESDSEGEGDD